MPSQRDMSDSTTRSPAREAAGDLDVLERGAPELDGDAARLAAAEHEQRGGRVRLADRRARDVEDVAGARELDHAVDVLVGARRLRQRGGRA